MASEAVFLDSNGWVALLCRDDLLHARAVRCWTDIVRARCSVTLTDWIVAETGNSLARTAQRREFPGAVRDLLSSPRARIISVTPSLRERALDLYAARPDKTWGLVDCASFIVMQDEKITEGFTTDRHFEQAGFKCLLPLAAA